MPDPTTPEITIEEAMQRLDVIPDYDPGGGPGPCVHTFAQSSVGMLRRSLAARRGAKRRARQRRARATDSS